MSTNTLKTPLEMLYHWEKTQPDAIYLRQPIDGIFQEYSWHDVGQKVRRLASALIAQNFDQGSHIAIFSKNCAEWFIADLAIMMAGHVSVPIYATAGPETIQYVLNHSHCRAVFIGKLDDTQNQCNAIPESVKRLGFPYPNVENADIRLDFHWSALQAQPTHPGNPVPDLKDTMTIIYTSGSTGNPKGVVNTYGSYAFASQQFVDTMAFTQKERALSYLPLAHITERTIVEGSSFYCGCEISFVESLDTFVDDLKSVSPTLFLSVPRLWTRFQMGVLAKMSPKKLNLLLSVPILNKVIARKIRQQLGLDSVRVFGSGSAPLSPATIRWYQRIGINITEAWGMSETNALGTNCHPFRSDKVGSIGRPYSGVELRIADDGEIQVRGDFLMKEYYLEPEKTAEVFTDDGFLRTGDKGEVDADGYVKITGRLKEIFKTAKGKYVAPVPIESRLMENPLIEQICVTGSNLKQPIALVVLTPEAQQHDQQHIRASLMKTLEKTNNKLESHAVLDGLLIVQEAWTPDNGLLTPTLKIRRHLLEGRYQQAIQQELTDKVIWL